MATNNKQSSQYLYEGKNLKGKTVKGKIQANSAAAAKILLKNKDIRVTKLIPKPFAQKFSIFTPKINPEDISIFMRQMATMLNAGVPVVQSLQATLDGLEKKRLIALIDNIKLDVESGLSLSEAFAKHPSLFDQLVCNLIEAGEQSGKLDVMLDRIAVYKERSESLKRKIKKAMYYPITVLVIATIVTVILLIKVVPTFKDLFAGFGADLPDFTLFVLDISAGLQRHWLKLLIGLALGGYGLVYVYKTKARFRSAVQKFMLKLPIFGNILKSAIIARFTRTLATTFAAGVPLTDALASVARTSGNIVFHNAILNISNNVSAGQSIHEAMRQCQIFPSIVVQMVSIGEESGSLETMLTKIANIYEEKVTTAVDGLTTLLEPLIMLILGVVVGGLVVAMYLPIFKIGSII